MPKTFASEIVSVATVKQGEKKVLNYLTLLGVVSKTLKSKTKLLLLTN